MTTVPLRTKGQLTIPSQLRYSLCPARGDRQRASFDHQGRMVLVPWQYIPEELFRHRTPVWRPMSLDAMGRASRADALSVLSFGQGFAGKEGVVLLTP